MKHRTLSMLVALALLFSLLPQVVLPASAASSLSASDDVVEFIKKMEGFSPNAHWDSTQWSIGYGTTSYAGATITREEAEAALRRSLTSICEAINQFLASSGLSLTQSQFDALVSLSYNCGTTWTKDGGRLNKAILNGYTGNDFLFAISLWANVGSVPEPGLLKRRLCEANMYLNGEYSLTVPSDYTYVIYDANGGVPGSGSEDKMQGYDKSGSAKILVADPTKSGASFLGWYTSPVGGTKVTSLGADTAERTLYAHWSDGTAQSVIATGKVKCETSVNVRSGAGTGYSITARVTNGTELSFFEFKTVGSMRWGRFSSGWICMDYVTLDDGDTWTGNSGGQKDDSTSDSGSDTTDVIATGKVSSTTNLNVRSGAGTKYTLVRTLRPGAQVTIYEKQTVNGVEWGRIGSNAWVCMLYVTLDNTQADADTSEGESAIASGKVSSSTNLNVRSGAGTNYTLVKTLRPGTQVSVYEKKTVNGVQWGRIDANNWVCLQYVQMDKDTSDSDAGDKETDSAGTSGSMIAIATGKVSSVTNLNVRSGPGAGYALVKTFKPGTAVSIYEKKTVGASQWGRVDGSNWVCLDYVTLDDTANGQKPSESEAVSGRVISSNGLIIRKDAGTQNAMVGSYPNGASVVILERKTVNGVSWGRTERGWICLTYVSLSGSSGGNSLWT